MFMWSVWPHAHCIGVVVPQRPISHLPKDWGVPVFHCKSKVPLDLPGYWSTGSRFAINGWSQSRHPCKATKQQVCFYLFCCWGISSTLVIVTKAKLGRHSIRLQIAGLDRNKSPTLRIKMNLCLVVFISEMSTRLYCSFGGLASFILPNHLITKLASPSGRRWQWTLGIFLL